MSYTAETLDLSRLGAPTLVDPAFQPILDARLQGFRLAWEAERARNPSLPAFDTLMLETEPARLLTREYAFGDMLLKAAINDASNSLRLATAVGTDLEHLAATYHGTQKQLLVAANPTFGTAAVYEGDSELRERAQLAPEALADMGLTPGGYVYKVRTAFADRIKHVVPINRDAGRVELRVLGRSGDGTVGPALLAEIANAFRAEEGTQSTDVLTVLSAEVVAVPVIATIVLPAGPDPEAVRAVAQIGIETLRTRLHRLGAATYREAISNAAHVGPVTTVRVPTPALDIPGRPETAPLLGPIIVSTEVAS